MESIRRRHPEYSDAEVARTFLKVVYRIDLAGTAGCAGWNALGT